SGFSRSFPSPRACTSSQSYWIVNNDGSTMAIFMVPLLTLPVHLMIRDGGFVGCASGCSCSHLLCDRPVIIIVVNLVSEVVATMLAYVHSADDRADKSRIGLLEYPDRVDHDLTRRRSPADNKKRGVDQPGEYDGVRRGHHRRAVQHDEFELSERVAEKELHVPAAKQIVGIMDFLPTRDEGHAGFAVDLDEI